MKRNRRISNDIEQNVRGDPKSKFRRISSVNMHGLIKDTLTEEKEQFCEEILKW